MVRAARITETKPLDLYSLSRIVDVMSRFREFLAGLMEDGRVVVGMEEFPAFEQESARDQLVEYELHHRNSLSQEAPPFDPSIALAAAVKFYQACQFTLNRDLDAKALGERLSASLTPLDSPEAHYSVDLTFRFLPDLARFARSAAEQDPLVEHLHQWAIRWPLSSVGMSVDELLNIDGIASHPALLQLYVDRIFKTSDIARLSDPRVRTLAESNLGLFPNLCPKIANALPRHEDAT